MAGLVIGGNKIDQPVRYYFADRNNDNYYLSDSEGNYLLFSDLIRLTAGQKDTEIVIILENSSTGGSHFLLINRAGEDSGFVFYNESDSTRLELTVTSEEETGYAVGALSTIPSGEQTPVYEHQIQLNYYFESDHWINITGYIFLIDNDPTPVELPRDFSRLVGVYQPKRRCCLSVMQEGGRGVLDLCAFRDRDDVITLIGYGAEYNSSNVITEFYSLNHELSMELEDGATYDVTDNVVQIV